MKKVIVGGAKRWRCTGVRLHLDPLGEMGTATTAMAKSNPTKNGTTIAWEIKEEDRVSS